MTSTSRPATPTPGAFAVDGTLTIDELDYNHAADGFDRLDWNTALDLDDDGFIDLVDPGADLTPPVVLTINLPDTLHYRSQRNRHRPTPLLTAGPVTITGSADFALSRWDVNLGTLDSTALVVDGATLAIDDLASVTLDGSTRHRTDHTRR